MSAIPQKKLYKRIDNARYFSHFQKRQFPSWEWVCVQQQP